MNRKRWGRVGGIAVVGAAMIGVLKACAPLPAPSGPTVEGLAPISHFKRDATGGGLVTVYVVVWPGPLPDLSMTGPATKIASFSNYGEGGKHEKRYDWKPDSQAEYDLVLSNDRSGRTKWEMIETNSTTQTQMTTRSGHLWACDTTYHPSLAREVGFKDCGRKEIPYNKIELSLSPVRNQLASFASYLTSFVSYIKGSDAEANETLPVQDGPIWISCTSGCCTLGA
jgi:hypothetical protein